MTKDKLLELARQVGFLINPQNYIFATEECTSADGDAYDSEHDITKQLIKFAELVERQSVNAELLSALKACLKKGNRWHSCDPVILQAKKAIANAEKKIPPLSRTDSI